MKKAIAMKCTQEDWDSIKDLIPKDIKPFMISKFKKNTYIVLFTDKSITNGTIFLREDKIIHETFNAKIFLEACGYEVEQKFEITKEQVLELSKDAHPSVAGQLKQWFPEVFKKELVVGVWYKNKYNCLFCITEKDDEKYRAYGFMQGKWKDYGEFTNEHDLSIDTESTPQEVETALIGEANKRGYKESVICVFGTDKIERRLNNKPFRYSEKFNCLLKGEDIICDNGKWAPIIETITIQEAEKLLKEQGINKKIV